MSRRFSFLGSLCCAKKEVDLGGSLYARVRGLEDVAAAGRHELCVFSVGQDEAEEEFEEKALQISGCESEAALRCQLASAGAAVSCRCGRHAGVPNQDSFLLCRSGELTVLGIADGFGDSGHWAADWVVRFALASTLAEPGRLQGAADKSVLEELFSAVQRALKLRSSEDGVDITVSGSTLSLVVVDHGARSVVSAWVGDSKCVLGETCVGMADGEASSSTASGPCWREVDALTMDDDPRGSSGPVVRNPAVERRLGNLAAHGLGSSHTPATKCITCGSMDAFVLCCTDAVWEQIETQEAIDSVGRAGRSGVRVATEGLVRLSQTRCLDALAASDETYEDMSAAIIWV